VYITKLQSTAIEWQNEEVKASVLLATKVEGGVWSKELGHYVITM
jgi:hypothetical protein